MHNARTVSLLPLSQAKRVAFANLCSDFNKVIKMPANRKHWQQRQ